MMLGAIGLMGLTVLGWTFVFVPDRAGIWTRSWSVGGALVIGSIATLWAAGELGDAVGRVTFEAVGAGIVVGAAWVVATQIGHLVLCRWAPGFIAQVRDLYAIAAGDARRDILVALVLMGAAEEFVFRLVVQREFGIVVAVIAYSLVQVVERNWALVVAGAACGTVWGLLYAWQEALAAPLLAHLVWTVTLTFVWPLRGCGGDRVPEADGVAVTDLGS